MRLTISQYGALEDALERFDNDREFSDLLLYDAICRALGATGARSLCEVLLREQGGTETPTIAVPNLVTRWRERSESLEQQAEKDRRRSPYDSDWSETNARASTLVDCADELESALRASSRTPTPRGHPMTTTRDRLRITAENYTESRPDETIDAYPVREDREVLTYTDARRLDALVDRADSAIPALERAESLIRDDGDILGSGQILRLLDALRAITQDDAGGRDG